MTRSAVIEMKDERRAMHEGWVFLDEKCLVLAGEILAELARHGRLQREFDTLHAAALDALRAAVARHGLRGLQVQPPVALSDARVDAALRQLMGVQLQQCRFEAGPGSAPAASVDASAQADAARKAYTALLPAATALAATAGNLERLSAEYRRALRRARALHDVLLPEIDRGIRDAESWLEEGEQEDAVFMRRRG